MFELTKVNQNLIKSLGIKNPMALPRLQKIVINTGVGQVAKNKGDLEKVASDLAQITGQKPKVAAARISVAGFGVRAGMPVGLMVTLRGKRMYDFFQKLTSLVLPRLRDFRGVPVKSFDKSGNYTLGLSEHTIFPEIDITKVVKPIGLSITFVINTGDAQISKKLLEALGLPFAKEEK